MSLSRSLWISRFTGSNRRAMWCSRHRWPQTLPPSNLPSHHALWASVWYSWRLNTATPPFNLLCNWLDTHMFITSRLSSCLSVKKICFLLQEKAHFFKTKGGFETHKSRLWHHIIYLPQPSLVQCWKLHHVPPPFSRYFFLPHLCTLAVSPSTLPFCEPRRNTNNNCWIHHPPVSPQKTARYLQPDRLPRKQTLFCLNKLKALCLHSQLRQQNTSSWKHSPQECYSPRRLGWQRLLRRDRTRGLEPERLLREYLM